MTYYWQNVDIEGGGYCIAVHPHPTTADRVAICSDVAGWYMYQPTTESWKMIGDFTFEQNQYWGGAGFAWHPTDPNTFWCMGGQFTTGGYLNGGLFTSSNGGTTLTQITSFPLIPFGSNQNYRRFCSQRMAVCPTNPSIIIVCGYSDSSNLYSASNIGKGIVRSADAGTTWTSIQFGSLCPGYTPNSMNTDNGQTIIVFDDVNSNVVYCAIFGLGFSRSTDYGVTWTFIGGPIYGMTACVYQSVLYCASFSNNLGELSPSDSSYSGLSKYSSGSWTNIYSNEMSYIALNKANGEMTCGVYYNRHNQRSYWNYSTNQWSSYTEYDLVATNIFATQLWPDGVPYALGFGFTSFAYDSNNGKAWCGDDYFPWQNSNYHTTGDLWINPSINYETTVIYDFKYIPTSAGSTTEYVWSGMYDISGFKHDRGLAQSPTQKIAGAANTTVRLDSIYNLDYCKANPNFIYFVTSDYGSQAFVAHSTDGGNTWVKDAGLNLASRVAVSSSNPTLVVAIQKQNGSPPYFSYSQASGGNLIWNPFTNSSLPTFAYPAFYYTGKPLCSIPDVANSFYCLNDDTSNTSDIHYGYLYEFTYDPTSYSMTATVINTSLPKTYGVTQPCNVAASYGGVVFVSLCTQGLWLSTNYGVTFTQITAVSNAQCICFGKAATGSSYETLYCAGVVNGVYSVWESQDLGTTWIARLDDTSYSAYNISPGCLIAPVSISASSNNYGQIILSVGGHGGIYSSTTAPSSGGGSSGSNSGGGASSGGQSIILNFSSFTPTTNTVNLLFV